MSAQPTEKENARTKVSILFIDIQGYTAMMHENEEHALRVIQRFKKVVKSETQRAGGSIIQYYGDACLITFSEVNQAMRCAYRMQTGFQEEIEIPVRMGLHAGDVWQKKDNIYGDSVNIASRIESMGLPKTILLSARVNEQLDTAEFMTSRLGIFRFKNLPMPVEVYALNAPGLRVPRKQDLKGKFDSNHGGSASRRWLLVLIAAILVFAAYAVSSGFFSFGEKSGDTPVVAVYPVEDHANPDNRATHAFLAAVAENLSYTKGMITIWPSDLNEARTLMLQANLVPEGDEKAFLDLLKVTHYVKLSMNQAPHIALHKAGTRETVWEYSFKNEEGIPDVQEVYLGIIHMLGIKPGPEFLVNNNQARRPEVVELLKQSLHYWHDRQNEDSYFKSVELLLEAEGIDATDEKVNGLLSLVYQTGIEREYFSSIEVNEVEKKIRNYANRALLANPRQPYALIAKGSNAFYNGDIEQAKKYLLQAHDVAPDMGLTTQALADFSLYTGNYADALKYIRQANAALPGDKTILRYLSWCLMSNGFLEASKENTERHLTIYPDTARKNYYLWAYHLVKKGFDKALRHIPEGNEPAFRSLMEGITYLDAGLAADFDNVLERLRKRITNSCAALNETLPKDKIPEHSSFVKTLTAPFENNPNGFNNDIDYLLATIQQNFLTAENTDILRPICMDLESSFSAYNSLILLHHLHSGDQDEKEQARNYYQAMKASGSRLPIHWLVQTYPFECFNSFRSDPAIQEIASGYGIRFAAHPWFRIQQEAG